MINVSREQLAFLAVTTVAVSTGAVFAISKLSSKISEIVAKSNQNKDQDVQVAKQNESNIKSYLKTSAKVILGVTAGLALFTTILPRVNF